MVIIGGLQQSGRGLPGGAPSGGRVGLFGTAGATVPGCDLRACDPAGRALHHLSGGQQRRPRLHQRFAARPRSDLRRARELHLPARGPGVLGGDLEHRLHRRCRHHHRHRLRLRPGDPPDLRHSLRRRLPGRHLPGLGGALDRHRDPVGLAVQPGLRSRQLPARAGRGDRGTGQVDVRPARLAMGDHQRLRLAGDPVHHGHLPRGPAGHSVRAGGIRRRSTGRASCSASAT